ncbi:MAG: helix-turn-helix transcriptional regulator [Parasporobacterium sp.]|nr:helix-turn-helix transcriptional regulator [Parasporobacterium sp.]
MEELKISLAAARVNAGLTQDEVANQLGVSNKTVGNWEKGVVIPNSATVFMLSDLYKIPKDNIFLPEKST